MYLTNGGVHMTAVPENHFDKNVPTSAKMNEYFLISQEAKAQRDNICLVCQWRKKVNRRGEGREALLCRFLVQGKSGPQLWGRDWV
jgi:hypothetical protein